MVRTKETGFFVGYNPKEEDTRNDTSKLRRVVKSDANKGTFRERAGAPPASPRTISQYLDKYFPSLYPGDGLMTGEATPGYIYAPQVPAKLRNAFPHARLILMLREPVERAYSRVAHAASLTCAKFTREPRPLHCQTGGVSKIFDKMVEMDLPGVQRCLSHTSRFWNSTNQQIGPSSEVLAQTQIRLQDHQAPGLHHQQVPEKLQGAPERPPQNAVPEPQDALHPQPHGSWKALYDCFKAETAEEVKENDKQSVNTGQNGIEKSFLRHCIQLQTMPHGLYAKQLLHWLQFFPREQILVIKSEDFFANTATIMAQVEQHLNLSPFDWSTIVQNKYNVGVESSSKKIDFVKEKAGVDPHPVSAETRQKMGQFFEPHNQQFLDTFHIPLGGPRAASP